MIDATVIIIILIAWLVDKKDGRMYRYGAMLIFCDETRLLSFEILILESRMLEAFLVSYETADRCWISNNVELNWDEKQWLF